MQHAQQAFTKCASRRSTWSYKLISASFMSHNDLHKRCTRRRRTYRLIAPFDLVAPSDPLGGSGTKTGPARARPVRATPTDRTADKVITRGIARSKWQAMAARLIIRQRAPVYTGSPRAETERSRRGAPGRSVVRPALHSAHDSRHAPSFRAAH